MADRGGGGYGARERKRRILMLPESALRWTCAMKSNPHHFGASRLGLRALVHTLPLGLLTVSLPAAPQADAGQAKVPALLPHVDADQDKDAWIAPDKDGKRAAALGYQDPAEHAALDAALEARHGRQTGAGDGAKPAGDRPTTQLGGATPADAHFQLDTASNGDLWAFGGSYKARFGRDGASYIPFLGSDAPRNFPLTFSLERVTSGGAVVAFPRDVAPAFEGDAAVYRRGTLVERYDVALGRVEQSFVFDTLPSAGELVVIIDVQSELVGQGSSNGLSFVNERGRVDYSGAIAIDADGRRLALATELVDGDVRIVVPAAFISLAALPLVIDPVITTWNPNVGTSLDFQSDIAYDASQNRFLVVYEREFSAADHDVWGELFSPSTGAPIAGSGIYVDFTGAYWSKPRCANNRLASQFLVVAELQGAPVEIWGRTREAEDTTQGAQFQVSAAGGSGDKVNPDVGGDPELTGPTYYCVVWERVFSAGIDHDVHARVVRTNSTLLGTSVLLIDNTSATYDKFPTISKHNGLAPFSDQAWNIAWSRQFSVADWDVRGAQVRWDGTVQAPSFSLDFSGNDHWRPVVSTSLTPSANGREYLVAYELYGGSEVDIQATAMAGTTLLASTNLSDLLGVAAGLDSISPAVETDGNHFAVAFSEQFVPGSGDYDVYIAGVYLAGSTLHVSEGPVNLAFSGSFEGDAQITALYGAGYSSSWLGVSWTDNAGTSNIEAATYSLPGSYGPFIGTRYCSPAVPNSTGTFGRIEAQGAGHAGGQPLHLVATQLPNNVFAYFLASPNAASTTTPATSGVVCVGNPLSRFNGPGQVGNTGSIGRISLDVNTNSIPLPTGGVLAIGAGTTFRFQAWYRDGATNNLTDAVAVLFN